MTNKIGCILLIVVVSQAIDTFEKVHDDFVVLDSSLKMTVGRDYGIGHFEFLANGGFCVIQNFDDDLSCGTVAEKGVMIDLANDFFNIYRGFFIRICPDLDSSEDKF